ncbi:MAG: type II toxin-antitoxin system HicB family antitoxin [Dehalococcoidia bacterium]|nr:type II toxin-antitoxin system HicB family antitoxin [Dehalococcoidia bacterium]
MPVADLHLGSGALTRPVPSYTVHFLPSRIGGFIAVVPALPGCLIQGDSLEDAEANAREAILVYLESLAKDGLPFPADNEASVQRVNVVVDAY